jgi:hypothetical protein
VARENKVRTKSRKGLDAMSPLDDQLIEEYYHRERERERKPNITALSVGSCLILFWGGLLMLLLRR